MERLIIDTDTAGDDCVSLLIALRSPNVTVEAITINCGNVSFEQQVEIGHGGAPADAGAHPRASSAHGVYGHAYDAGAIRRTFRPRPPGGTRPLCANLLTKPLT